MLTIAKVLDVELRPVRNGQMCSITLKSGADVVTPNLFNKDITEGRHKFFAENLGQEILVDISSEIYNDKLQHRFGFTQPMTMKEYFLSVAPKPAPAPQAAKTA